MMKLVTLAVACLLPFTRISWAGQDEGAAPCVCLTVELTDGSRLMGESPVESVVLHAPYGKLSLPFVQIRKIVLNADRETAQLTMANGDSLKGVIGLGDLELETIFGKIEIPLVHVVEISVAKGGLDRGLVAYYPFDEDANDASGNGPHGTVHGAKWTANGKVGGAYAFDGVDDHIAAAIGGLGPGTSELSVSCWVRASKMTPCAGLVCDRYQPLSLHCIRGLILDGRDQTHQPAFFVPGGAVVAPEGTMKEGEWTHVAGVWKAGTTLRLYVNGEVVRSDDKQSPGVTAHRSGNWKVGWDEDGSSRRFNGVLDDVRIYDRALSDREVRDLYEATGTGRR